MTVENTFAVNWVLALKQVTIWTAERKALPRGLIMRRQANAVSQSRSMISPVGSSDPLCLWGGDRPYDCC